MDLARWRCQRFRRDGLPFGVSLVVRLSDAALLALARATAGGAALRRRGARLHSRGRRRRAPHRPAAQSPPPSAARLVQSPRRLSPVLRAREHHAVEARPVREPGFDGPGSVEIWRCCRTTSAAVAGVPRRLVSAACGRYRRVGEGLHLRAGRDRRRHRDNGFRRLEGLPRQSQRSRRSLEPLRTWLRAFRPAYVRTGWSSDRAVTSVRAERRG